MHPRLHPHRLQNLAATFALITGIVATAALVGWLLGGAVGAVFTLLAAVALGVLAPLPPTERALARQGARRIWAPWLEDAVATLSERAGIEPPALVVLPAATPQAFATEGQHGAAIGLTPSLLNGLTQREIVAVVAHELAHLSAGDLGLMRVVGVVHGLTRSLAQLGFVFLLFGLPLSLLGGWSLPWVTVLALVAAPWGIHAMTLALSRLREHEADATAAELTGDPLALASALLQIEAASRGPWWVELFRFEVPDRWRTHPRTEERVARLRALAGHEPQRIR
ncbi:MAG: M48 family metalloprotease [Sandaracinaceae bacterium]|nr:M48 family metalloprotease [Sandaracinaceae bacterium]